jgi:hypothetical protein
MDESRANAYLELIHTLLNCPTGQEPQILQDNIELLDRGFLQTCEIIAETLAEQGGENSANFLRDLAAHLAEFMDAGEANENLQESANFFLELLRAEQDSNSDIQVIYPMLDRQQHLLDSCFAETVQQVAQRLIDGENPQTIRSILALIENLSVHISEFPGGEKANNMEIAIAGYQIVLNNSEPDSEEFARSQNNLAVAYKNRING